MERIVIKRELAFASIMMEVTRIGDDYQVLLLGGDKVHLGCMVLATPRLSLKEDGTDSCTASVVNVIGHKDEVICRLVAEQICIKKRAVVVCTGGFHVDNIKSRQIDEVIRSVKSMVEEIK
ncbi:hypothetical protein M2150_001945 [Lachnospiraceae bacterium PM6-15]|uniref:prenylated flavin chaperone LpdD n=1 Tax=Ohessyouella blattaphilus TaxID=2949333 RepID=UPI003E1FA817